MKLIFAVIVGLSQFAFAQQDVSQRVNALAKERADLEGIIGRKSFTEEDHKVIRAYFSSLNSFDADLETFPKYRRRFDYSIRSIGVASFCENVFLDQGRYRELISNCTKNRYFLCSDEVMTFKDTKKKLSEKLEADLKTEFEKLSKCN